MSFVRTTFATAVLATAVLAPAAVHAQPQLGVIQGAVSGLYYGQTNFSNVTNTLNNTFGSANVQVLANMTDAAQVMAKDALWIDLRAQNSTLSAVERNVFLDFVAAGKRVFVVGENSGWATWNNSFLGALGGSYTTPNVFNVSTIVLDNELTAGMTAMRTASAGTAVGGDALFNRNIATLWGDQQNVLTFLDASILTNQWWLDAINGGPSNEAKFVNNVSAWLAAPQVAEVPEPSSAVLMGAALLAMFAVAGRRRRSAA
jgi:hypothetical protein